MSDDYYETEIVKVTVEVEIKYKRGSAEARKDALQMAEEVPFKAGGAGAHGCYGARRLETLRVEPKTL